jgi:hypothetical protein
MKLEQNGFAAVVVFAIIALLVAVVVAAFAWMRYDRSHQPTAPETAATESSTPNLFLAFNDFSGVTIEFPQSWGIGKISNSIGDGTYGPASAEVATTSILFPNNTQGVFEIDMDEKTPGDAAADDPNNLTNITNFGSGAKPDGAIDQGFLFTTIGTNTTCSWGMVLTKQGYDYYLGVVLWLPVDAYGTNTTMNEPYQTYCNNLDEKLHHASLL